MYWYTLYVTISKAYLVIKQYENDKPLSSCLVLGFSIDNKNIHIVAMSFCGRIGMYGRTSEKQTD